MKIKTGITVYEIVVSSNQNNNPVTGVTFDFAFFIDGTLTTSIVPDIYLSNIDTGTYTISWSASTYGTHQLYAKNLTTNIIYMSDIYLVRPDNEVDPSPTIYVGL